MSTWGEIAAECQDASGADRDLNATVLLKLSFDAERPGMIPDLTSSVDAILALIAEKLPERVVKLDNEDDGWGATIFHQEDGAAIRNGNWSVPIFDGEGKTPALSLLVAFSLAMEAEEASQGKEGERG